MKVVLNILLFPFINFGISKIKHLNVSALILKCFKYPPANNKKNNNEFVGKAWQFSSSMKVYCCNFSKLVLALACAEISFH